MNSKTKSINLYGSIYYQFNIIQVLLQLSLKIGLIIEKKDREKESEIEREGKIFSKTKKKKTPFQIERVENLTPLQAGLRLLIFTVKKSHFLIKILKKKRVGNNFSHL